MAISKFTLMLNPNIFLSELVYVLFSGSVWLFATPWTAARQASLSFTISWSLLKLVSIELMMPSNHLTLCCQPLLLPSFFPSIWVFSSELALCIRWTKYCSFSFSISPFSESPGLISFSIDWFDLLAVQGTLKNLLQHHSSKASILRLSVHLSRPYMTTGKATASSWFLLSTNSVYEGRGGRTKGHFSGCGRLMESSSFGEQRLFQLQGLCTCCSLCLMLFEKWVPLYPSDLSSRATPQRLWPPWLQWLLSWSLLPLKHWPQSVIIIFVSSLFIASSLPQTVTSGRAETMSVLFTHISSLKHKNPTRVWEIDVPDACVCRPVRGASVLRTRPEKSKAGLGLSSPAG